MLHARAFEASHAPSMRLLPSSGLLRRACIVALWFAVILLAPASGGAEVAPGTFTLEARRADFSVFCMDFAENYAYADRAQKPWLSWRTRYGSRVDAATTPEAFAATIEAALDELHDFHAEVRSRNADRWLAVPTFSDIWAAPDQNAAVVLAVRDGSDAQRAGVAVGDRIVAVHGIPLGLAIAGRLHDAADGEGAPQWAVLSLLTGRDDEQRVFTVVDSTGRRREVTLPQRRRVVRPADPVSAATLPGGVGVIRFNNSLGDQKTVHAFDVALAALRDTRALMLDLRDVPSGGDTSVALGIMGRFVSRMQPYQRHRIPRYGQDDVERNWVEMVAPRGPFTYDAPVAVLVDHWTGSMGEGIAIGFDGMQRAVVVGTPMARLAGAVSDFVLPQTRIDVAYATEQLFHVDGTPRESWLPPVLVPDGPRLEQSILQHARTALDAVR
jgi:carboxyl-terminal processing protease